MPPTEFTEIDFTQVDRNIKSCPHRNNYGNLFWPVYSKEFHDYLEKLDQRRLIYGAYLCKVCGFPAEENVIWCWPCQSYFYGTQRSECCVECKEYM